jgi:uncharacterized membrane protein
MNYRALTFMIVLMVLVALPAQAQPRYTLTELGGFTPVAINTHGVVAGNVGLDSARWTPQHGVELLGSPFSPATGMNDRGEIIGISGGCQAEEDVNDPFIWSEERGFQCIPRVVGSDTYVYGINNEGEIVGQAQQDTGPTSGPLYWASPTSQPKVLMEVSDGAATDINERGEVIGWFQCDLQSPCQDGSFVGDPDGGMTVVSPVPLAIIAINDAGVRLSPDGQLVFRRGATFNIGQPEGCTDTQAVALNNLLLIVGQSVCDGITRAWLWSAIHGFTDLTAAVGSPDWILETAVSINGQGQIVGEGRYQGQPYGYLLTP